MFTITIVILLLTCIISFTAFSNAKVMEDFIFYPPAIDRENQWYRFVSSGFIHADFMQIHLSVFPTIVLGGRPP